MEHNGSDKPVFQFQGMIMAERDPIFALSCVSILGPSFFVGKYCILTEIESGENIHAVILDSTCN